MYGRLLRRLHNFFPLRAGFCNSDIVRNRIVEQVCLLRHIAFHIAQMLCRDFADIGSVHGNAPRLDIPEAHQKF